MLGINGVFAIEYQWIFEFLIMVEGGGGEKMKGLEVGGFRGFYDRTIPIGGTVLIL